MGRVEFNEIALAKLVTIAATQNTYWLSIFVFKRVIF
jgi:hypothetical protein